MIDSMLAQASSWTKAPTVAVAALLLVCAGVACVSDSASVAAPAGADGSIASPGWGGRGSGEALDAGAWPDQLALPIAHR